MAACVGVFFWLPVHQIVYPLFLGFLNNSQKLWHKIPKCIRIQYVSIVYYYYNILYQSHHTSLHGYSVCLSINSLLRTELYLSQQMIPRLTSELSPGTPTYSLLSWCSLCRYRPLISSSPALFQYLRIFLQLENLCGIQIIIWNTTGYNLEVVHICCSVEGS